jgi:hypothetical protein
MRRMRILAPVLILAIVFVLGILLINPSAAQNGPIWFPFDGTSEASGPEMILLGASPTEIRLQATMPGAYVEAISAEGMTYSRLSASEYGYPAEYGLPELPVLRQELEIPFGAQVSIEVISAEYTDQSLTQLGFHPIYPLQPPVPKIEGAEDAQAFTMDGKFYADGSRYPANAISLGEPYIVRGHRILPVEVWPVAYDPSQGSLRLYSQMVFRLKLWGADMATTDRLADRYASPVFDASLSKLVLNFNQGRTLNPNSTIGYLIITADGYSAALDPFIQLKESHGFEVTRTKTSEIPGGPTAANIKAYIKLAYESWPVPPSYILLVGDTDTIPTWTGPRIDTSTDLYYATMDGESDWHPDLGRGRFPVRSVDQTTYMVDKYLFYAGLTGQEAWLKTASFPATCDNYQVAEGTHNYVIDNYTAPGGWTGTFPNNPTAGGDKLYCITYGATHQDLLNQFNQGRWAIIYSGHGGYDGWEMGYSPTDIQNMPANSMYPFVASHACLTGDFGQLEVFGETWVLQQDKGAMVYWGSSTYSYWDEDDSLERAMFDSLFEENSPHSDVWTMTDAGLAGVEHDYPSSARYYWETYNILGDPSVHLFMEPEQPFFTLDIDPTSLAVCREGSMASSVEIGSVMGYSSTVYLDHGVLPFNVSASFDVEQSPAPFSSTLTLDVSVGASEGDHTILITATDQVSLTLSNLLNLRINTDLPITPTLLSPADGDGNQPFTPAFDWADQPLVSDYDFELATGPLFENPLVSVEGIPGSEYALTTPLEGGKCYWWKVEADNACGYGEWAQPFHFSTVALGVSFYDDIESGPGQWSHAAAQGVDHWAIASDQAHSPTHAWFVPDDGAVTDSRLWTTEPILVGEGSTLTFWQRYQFEGSNYDGSVLEISSNHGDSWADLGAYITANGYNGTIASGYSNPLAGRPGWTGDLTSWTEVTVDLSSFAGQEVMIRWRLGCDSSVSDVGWYIDDVQITSPLPPNPTPTLLSITPDSGNNGIPTPVVITGTNFIGAPALLLGNTWLESVTMVTSSTLAAVVPAGIPDGVYDLTIFNGDCQEDTLEDAFMVFSGEVPITGLVASNDSPTMLGGLTTFTATVDTGSNITYTWEFGDGATGEGQSTTHVYVSAGVYTATVTATNSLDFEVATTEVTIITPPLRMIYLPVTYK